MSFKHIFLVGTLFLSGLSLFAKETDKQLASCMKEYEAIQKGLARGWNTWDVRSVLNHVYLPYGFSIDLNVEDSVGRRVRRFRIGDRGADAPTLRPGSHAYDGSYTDVEVSWHGMKLQVTSASEGSRSVILLRPLDGSAAGKVVVTPRGIWGRGVKVEGENADFTLATPDKSVTIKGTIAGKFLEKQRNDIKFSATEVVAICCDTVLSQSEAVAYVQRRSREFESTNRKRWGADYDSYNSMQSVLAWDNIYDPETRRVMSPVSRIWSSDWFGSQDFGGFTLFCWDTYFAALMFSIDNKELAYANAVEITLAADGVGFVPNCYYSNGYRSRDRSQPPVGSMTVWKLYERYHDRWLLELLYPRLLMWNRWWNEHRQLDGLLCLGSEAYEKVSYYNGEYSAHTRYGSILESGLDNSPMYDGVPYDAEKSLLMQHDVGITSLYVMDCKYLATIAKELGYKKDARELEKRGKLYSSNLDGLWSEADGMYLNRSAVTGKFNHRMSPTNFYPLLAWVASNERAMRMVREHLLNTDEFWGEWVIPACPRNDPAFRDNDYWRGRIWAPLNFLVYLGLKNYDFPEVRRQFAEKSKNLLLKSWLSHGYVFENYNATTGEGDDTLRSDKFYHWGALLGLVWLMENGRF